MYRSIIFAVFLFMSSDALIGQELNLGVHLNPTLTNRIISSRSVYDREIRPVFFTVGINAGLNLNYKVNNDMSIESGVNIIKKSMRFNDLRGGVFGTGADYYLRLSTTSIEFPLVVNYKVFHNDRKTTYDIYLLGGAAYEMINSAGTASGSSSSSTGIGGSLLTIEGGYNGNKVTSITPVLGFKINAILRNVGLIDYGLSYHFPLQVAGPFNIAASLGNAGGNYSYKGTIYAHMSYVDFKLCYYLLNLDRKFRKVRYRMGG